MSDKMCKLSFLAGVKYRGKIFFSAMQINGLFSYDIISKTTEFIKVFEREKIHHYLHSKAFLHNNEMWLVPFGAEHVASVNLETLEIHYYDIPKRVESTDSLAFLDGTIYNNCLYIIPYDAKCFLKMDFETRELTILSQFDTSMINWSRGCFVSDEKLLVVSSDGKVGNRIDLKTGECERVYGQIGLTDAYLFSFYSDGKIWKVPYCADRVLEYDLASARESTFPLPNPSDRFFRGMDIGKYVIFFPAALSRQFLIINKQNRQIRMSGNMFTGADEPKENWFELNVIESDNGSWATSINGVIFEVSTEARITIHHAEVNKETKRTICKEYREKGMYKEIFALGVVLETDNIIEVDDFLQYVINLNT